MEISRINLLTIAEGEDKSSPLGNRMRKNYRHFRKWAKRTDSDCFRIYDREIHHYPLAIDYYAGRFCVQYFSPSREIEEPPTELETEIEGLLQSIFGVSPKDIYWKTRVKRKRVQQYEKEAETEEFFPVHEFGAQFLINLEDYLDTGLFLDHRETRKIVAEASNGKRLLNLFAYTCSFSVHAALAGATYTKSVDMSNTYTDWGKENFKLNGLSLRNNTVVREDCLKFIDEEIAANQRYDVIVIDPPTISRSKKMDQMFDIQIDYVPLLSKALRLLTKEGVIFFSTNARRFDFDESQFPLCSIQEITKKTLPQDFHYVKVHQCWKISHA